MIMIIVIVMVVVGGVRALRALRANRAKASAKYDSSCPATIPVCELVSPDIVLTAIVLVIFQVGLRGFHHLT